jgi:hypothetical protein
MRRGAWSLLVTVALFASAGSSAGQPVPQPFPRPPDDRAPSASTPRQVPPQRPAAPRPAASGTAQRPAEEQAPSEELLGIPVYPGARFLRSYDAGAGQRYYLFGSTVPFAELVAYYRNVLKDRGELVYDVPPVHMFEVGRFREESMAFPPGVTVKDYTWGGAAGWLDPTPDASPQRYPTIIQIVPVAPADRHR